MPRSPHMNGVVERRNKTLKEMVRCMVSHSILPESLWGEAIKTATYIHNRVPTKATLMNYGLTENARFFKDVEFGGEDKVKEFIFEEEQVSFPLVVINYDQTSIPNMIEGTTPETQNDSLIQNQPKFLMNKLNNFKNQCH
ncbi:uncharacterized protein LOC110693292 [Chenopodium quinoa]|uniref:uncharacterized protein LOC110693292 n=1 Tax=Chenopodium quinoa TaxID=63459 RepID=UPI000B76FA15|nr:uncharacterized protein LOC110693292 [Chenopodium quinoa]